MLAVYLVVSAALFPLLDPFFNFFRRPHSWWMVPLLYLAFVLGMILIHLLVVVVAILAARSDQPTGKKHQGFRKLIELTLPMLFQLTRVKIRTENLEAIPQNTRFLLVCNHLHEVDPAVILTALPQSELGFIAKKDIYEQMPFVAKAMTQLQCIPIDRENNREAVRAILSAVKLLKEDQASIGVFPEGYTSKDGALQPMRNGAFKIATKAKVPIVVCTLKGTYKIHRKLFFHRSEVCFQVLGVIPVEEIATLNTGEIGDRVYRMMSDSLNQS